MPTGVGPGTRRRPAVDAHPGGWADFDQDYKRYDSSDVEIIAQDFLNIGLLFSSPIFDCIRFSSPNLDDFGATRRTP